jgi:branched-chain amino acid transport system substrate-binding protein
MSSSCASPCTHQWEKEEFVKIQAGLFARQVLGAVSVVALVGLGTVAAQAQTKKTVTVGITLPLTGADAQSATLIKNGAQMAIDEANAKGTIPGYKIDTIVLDSWSVRPGPGRDEHQKAGL